MSLAFAARPLRQHLTNGLRPCQVCGISARRQWQTSRSIHLSRSAIFQNTTLDARWTRLQRRSASTAPLKSGPAIDIPSFPSHSRPAPAAPPKIEVKGTAPSFEALKEHEDWGEDTELVDDAEARIFVTEPALNVRLASFLDISHSDLVLVVPIATHQDRLPRTHLEPGETTSRTPAVRREWRLPRVSIRYEARGAGSERG